MAWLTTEHHRARPYLVILGCLQVVVNQLKVQAILLLQGSMELCFLWNKQGKEKRIVCCCDIMIHYLPHCKDFYAWTASLRQAARRNSILKLLYKRQMIDSGLCRSLPLSVCMCEGLSFSLRCCLGGQNPQLHTVTLHLVCGIRDGRGELKKW